MILDAEKNGSCMIKVNNMNLLQDIYKSGYADKTNK